MPLMNLYLSIALFLCRITGTPVSFLLHPLDIIGGDQVKELAFFPGMNINSDRKVLVFKKIIGKIAKQYKLVNMSLHAESLLAGKTIVTKNIS